MDYKINIHADVEFLDFKMSADINEYSFDTYPKVIDHEYLIESYNKMMKRFKGYRRLVLTISGHTSDNGVYHKNIQSVRYVCNDHDLPEKSYLSGNQFNNWTVCDLKDVKDQIKAIISLVNHAQLTEKVAN